MLFLVPLVALANQKYERFTERYGALAKTGLLTGVSRLNLPETRKVGDRNPQAPILVGTYEGVDNMIRCGQKMHNIGTVVIDEVQMLEDPERGHRLDGLVARLKYLAPQAQYLYLSATIGSPKTLAKKLNCQLVRYDDRPVALERFLLFTERKQKIPTIKKLTTEEYTNTSSKGYRGQTIIFTNARARCHTIADALGMRAAAYHAGLSAQERREVETKFLGGKLMAVVTTAALGAGSRFPRIAGDFRCPCHGPGMALRAGVQPDGGPGRAAGLPRPRPKWCSSRNPGEAYSRETPGYRGRRLRCASSRARWRRSLLSTTSNRVRRSTWQTRSPAGARRRTLPGSMRRWWASMEPVLPELVAHRLVQKKGTNNRALPPCPRDVGALHRHRAAAGDRGACKKMDDPLDIIAELESEGMEKEAAQKEREGRKVASRGEEGARETVEGDIIAHRPAFSKKPEECARVRPSRPLRGMAGHGTFRESFVLVRWGGDGTQSPMPKEVMISSSCQNNE